MSRHLGSLLLALALALGLGLGSAAMLQPAAASPSATVAAEGPAKVIARRVKLGHKPIHYRSEKRTTVRLTFHGRRGQVVELDHRSFPQPCGRRVLFHQGSRVQPWATGFWKLRHTGTYTAVVRPCRQGYSVTDVTAQLRRVVLHPAPRVDGPATRIRGGRDATHLVGIRLRRHERLTVHATDHRDRLVLPDGSVATYIGGKRVALEVGSRIGHPSRVDAPGTHWLATVAGARIRVSRAATYEGRVDGPAVALDNRASPSREHVVSFSGLAGQWVYPELMTSQGEQVPAGPVRVRLLDADGDDVANAAATECAGHPGSTPCDNTTSGPWLLTATGTYRMSATVVPSAPAAEFSLRVRAAAIAEPVTVDGPPVTLAAATPGQWVVASFPDEAKMGRQLEATVSPLGSAPTDWKVSLVPGFVVDCGPEDLSLGCGDYFYETLTPRTPSSDVYVYGGHGKGFALLSVPPEVQGTLQLSLRSVTTP